METGVNKHQYEASETKVITLLSYVIAKAVILCNSRAGEYTSDYYYLWLQVRELEQKLELEKSSARRHDSQIQRLRNQLERAQEEKTETVSHQSSDALKRLQKQNRDLRQEMQEAERKEQEMSKKKRGAVSAVSANQRILVVWFSL